MALESDDKLVFLVSQPRAGSTMLQSILSAHTEIYTTSECWLMLLPLSAWQESGIEADYNHATWRRAVDSFLEEADLRRDTYFEGVSSMGRTIYDAAIEGREETLFVDKTPRYGYVLPELADTFREAKFILLFRNPVAVLTSIMNTFLPDQEYGLCNFERDLFEIPKKLLGASNELGDRVVHTRYEDLLEEPAKEVQRITDFLDVEFQPQVVNYGTQKEQSWQLGDPERVDKFQSPNSERKNSWVNRLGDAQVWRLAKNYLECLGADVFEAMGYDYRRIQKHISEYKPSRARLALTSSLRSCLSKSYDDIHNLEKAWRILRNGIRERRLAKSVRRIFEKGKVQARSQ